MTTTEASPAQNARTAVRAVADRLDLLADCIRGARGVPGDLDAPALYLDLADEYVAELRGVLAATGTEVM